AAVVAAEDLDGVSAPEMVPTDDSGHIPSIKAKAETLPPHRSIDHEINPGHKLPYGCIYYLLEVESRNLKAYIETNLANEEGRRLENQKLTTELSTRAQSRIEMAARRMALIEPWESCGMQISRVQSATCRYGDTR
ncbi:hypothetical protein K440DRAFT_609388, partial [Wilcoxina mikolae CBS 423.85]